MGFCLDWSLRGRGLVTSLWAALPPPPPQLTRKCCLAFTNRAAFMILWLNGLQNRMVAAHIDQAQLTEATRTSNLPEKPCRAESVALTPRLAGPWKASGGNTKGNYHGGLSKTLIIAIGMIMKGFPGRRSRHPAVLPTRHPTRRLPRFSHCLTRLKPCRER